MVHNLSFKMAYGGMKHFRPLEVFDGGLSAVMAGLLVWDLKCTNSRPTRTRSSATALPLHGDLLPRQGVEVRPQMLHRWNLRGAHVHPHRGPGHSLPVPLQHAPVLRLGLRRLALGLPAGQQLDLGRSPRRAHGELSPSLRFFQDLAFMEVVHSLLRMTSSHWMTVLIRRFCPGCCSWRES